MKTDIQELKMVFYLQILSEEGEKIKLPEGETTIGRGPGNSIVIDGRCNLASRNHAKIRFLNGKCYYYDHPSNKNGSYILNPKLIKPTNTEEKWIMIQKNSPYPVTKDTVIRMGGPYSIPEEGKLICDIKIIAEETIPKKTTVAHPRYKA